MLMPLTYSIAYGLIGGIMVFVLMEGTFKLLSFAGIAIPGAEEEAEEEIPVKETDEEEA